MSRLRCQHRADSGSQARLQFARRDHKGSFETYQTILKFHPHMIPDPRIGLGLSAWMLGDKERARAAWERAAKRVRDNSREFSSCIQG